MAQERPSRIGEWMIALRKQLPVLAGQVSEWMNEVRKEPRLFWETSAVRYATYLFSGAILLLGAKCGANMIAVPPPESAAAPARTADYHVVCTRAECGYHFIIHRRFGFSRFPVDCPKCKHNSGVEGRRCHAPACQGRWTYSRPGEVRSVCARCGETMPTK